MSVLVMGNVTVKGIGTISEGNALKSRNVKAVIVGERVVSVKT